MSDARDSGENRGYEDKLDKPGSDLIGVSFLGDVSFFNLVTRVLSDGLPLFVGLWPVIVDRKRE